MDPLSWLLLIPVLFLLGLSGFFSSSETAFACLNKYFFIVKADKGDKKASKIVALYEKFDDTLVAVLVGYNVCSVIISTLSTFFFISLFNRVIDNQWVSLISSVVASLLTFIFGDSIPKIIAKNNPSRIAEKNTNQLVFFIYLFYPLSFLFSKFTKLIRKLFQTKTPPQITEEDFTNVVEQIEAKGIIEENESDIIQASLDFAETKVKDVLTPLNKMYMIDLFNLTKAKLVSIIQQTDYSRIPVYFKETNNIVGILIVKNYLNELLKDPSISISNCLQKPYFVTPKVMLDDLLEGFKDNHTQIALVKSEGKIIGMVTSEDVLEELVGSINETSLKGEASL